MGQPLGDVEIDRFVGIADDRMDPPERRPRGCSVARFFGELPARCGDFRFARVELAGGEFDEDLAHRIAVLALDDEAAIG